MEFKVGDQVRVGRKVYRGRKWARGKVVSVYEKYMLIQLKKYRVTVADWELLDKTVTLEKAS